MSDIRERIRSRLSKQGLTVRAASLGAGRSGDWLGKFLNTDGQKTDPQVLAQLAAVLQTSTEWLVFGIGSPEDVDAYEIEGLRQTSALGMPILGSVAGGVWFEAEASQAAHDSGHVLPDPRFPAKSQYLLRAMGNSVNRVIEEGDLVHCVDILKAKQRPRDGDMVVVERVRASGEREVSAKRYRVRQDGKAELCAESTDARWKDYVLEMNGSDGDEIRIAAIIVKKLREFR